MRIRDTFSLPAAFLVFFAGVMLRVLLEMEDLTFPIFVHQWCWFGFVFMWFAVCFRYGLRVSPRRLRLLVLGTPIIFIPLVQCMLTGDTCSMNYVHMESPVQTMFYVATLLYTHPRNHPMFFELLTLLVGAMVLAYYLSRNIFRSVATAFTAFFGAFITAGFAWISVADNHPALVRFTAVMPPQVFYALFYHGLFSLGIGILLLPEIVRHVSRRMFLRIVLPLSLLIWVAAAVYLFFTAGSICFADVAVLLPLAVTASFLPVFFVRGYGLLFPVWLVHSLFPLAVLFHQ